MNVELKHMPELRLAALRHVGPYDRIGEAFSRLDRMAGPALFAPGAAMIAVYYDDPQATPADKLRADAAISIGSDEQVPDGLSEARVPAGLYASIVHRGSYEGLPQAWQRFMGKWLPDSGHRMKSGGATFEIYRNTPMSAPKEELVTELYLPLEA